ncbi:MazG nucleotide pyrophosphohydrolase domain-containing protein [Promethearchaeum syntrophicum]|uniref:MazG nucleotide pyrophosphohydrolase domain-containing protein n=1 Tax=Promethearchaeum syntrophicum TaxID=2594042 RepID=A0A5B9DBS0_9ARCH|nr:MazG nucleotide pyrophosphohydrolase domain-containing protein [Candidatus Prometheoarchaeum syntrophicum]
MEISEFQQKMRDLYIHNDKKRGIHRTSLWLGEEMGELMSELKYSIDKIDKQAVAAEMADIYAWVASLANLLEIDLQSIILNKYDKCPKCNSDPCICEKNLP